MSARRIWSISEADFPANSSPRHKLESALRYAALAPAEVKWQTWKARLGETHLELMANDDPVLEKIDPDGRESLLGCGSALLYLQLALRRIGCLGRVALFPDLNEPRLVARIHFGFCGARNAQERILFDAMARSNANASPLGEAPVSETMRAALHQAVAGERGWLDFVQSETSRQRVIEITLAGEKSGLSFGDSRARRTNMAAGLPSLRWPRSLFPFGGRDAASRNLTVGSIRFRSIPAMTLAVVKTKTDDKYGWVAAGLTMARAVLQAQALGLPWAFFNQVRRREAREALRLGVGHKGFAQVILRFGSVTHGAPVRPTTTPLGRQAP